MGVIKGAAISPAQLAYRNNVLSLAVGFFAMLATVVFIVQAVNPGKGGIGLTALAAVTASASAGLTARALFAPTITASYDGIRIRTFVRTRRYAWTDVDRFQVVVKLVGSYNRKVLAITLTNGVPKSFSQLNASPRRHGWVDEAVLKLNSCAHTLVSPARQPP